MAVTKITYTANGSDTQFTIPFEYIAEADVDVYVDTVFQLQQNTTSTADPTHPQVISGEITQGTALINYTFANATTIQFNSAPTNGAFIFIERTTDDASVVTFTPGSTIRAQELNSALEQVRFIAQEGTNTANDGAVPSKDNAASIDAQGKRLENLADANSDDDAVNRAQLGKVITDDLLEGEAIDLTDVTGGTNSNKQVTISVEDSSKTNKGAVSINEGHAIGVTYTSGDAVIAADKSTASQQGVVRLQSTTPITTTYTADGEVELSIADNSIDLQKIKGIDKAETSEYATTWDNDDDQLATIGALAARHDVVVSTTQPTTAQPGKQWLNITPGNQEHKIYDGSGWRTVAVGQPFTPATATIVRYVDATNGSDAADVTGFLPQAPLATIKRAVDLVNAGNADGTLIVVAPGVYQETLPIQIQRKNISIVGQALRSVFVQPTQATETNTMFECNTGTLLANMTFVGLKASGTRGNSTYDSDPTYGLPENQGWCAGFYSGAVIKKSPYIQNCTSFNDSGIDNTQKYDQTNLQAGGLGGDNTSGMTGGGILCDGSVPASSSPLRSFVVDSFTQINLDGPGILCTNNGYAQLVSYFGTFCHYHAKALNGGQLNLSNCTTDFGRYGLIADGRSPSAQITGSSVGTAAAGATSVVVDGLTAQGGFFSNQPGSTMIMEIGGNDYQILDATQVSGNQCTINVYRATNADPNTNLGLVAQINDNTSAQFKLRSYISTGGHTFEYTGSGTDYSAHPDYGGQAVEANQVVELGGTGSADDQIYNRGKVWQSSTDENGLFKVGDKFKVDQRRGTITLDGFTVSAEVISDTTPQLGGDLDLNSQDITGSGNINITGTVTATSYNGDGSSLTGISSDLVNDTTPQLGGDLDVNGQKIVSVSNGNIVFEPNGTGNITLTATSSLTLPVGTEAQRPGTPAAGMIRFNDDTDKFEGYDGANWGSLIGGDIGTDPENVPLNQFLGKQAFVDEVGTVIPSASDPQRNKDINFEYVSDTSIKIRMRGADGTVRSTTLTLS